MPTRKKPTTEPRAPGWVRSWDTEVPVTRSKSAFEELLRRYGAKGFTVSEDYASRTVAVHFMIDPGGDRDIVEVRLPLSYDTVLGRLKRMTEFVNTMNRRNESREWAQAQSERVAWRHLLLWAEAMLSAVDAGVYTLQEAVFAFTMLETPNGGKMPVIDAVNTMKRLSGGGR